MFWNHSDDHHPGELGRVRFPAPGGGLVEQTVPLADDDSPLFAREVGDAHRAKLAFSLQGMPHGAAVTNILIEQCPGDLSEAFSQMLLRLLGDRGLIVVEPRDVAAAGADDVLLRALREPSLVDGAVDAGARALEALGFKPPLTGPFGTNVYAIENGKRVRATAPSRMLSAGVAMRLILQDTALPTAAYVGGPNEVGYISQLRELYDAFGVPMPAIVPRISATLIEPRVARSADKLGLTTLDLFSGEEELLRRSTARHSRGVVDEIERASQEIESRLRGLEAELERIEKPLVDASRKAASKARLVLEALQRRIIDTKSQVDDVGRAHARKVATHVTPGGVLQERVFSPAYYLSMFGPERVGDLLEALDPTAFEHQVAWL
jgi:uncharacterized protein YllA (UPF0747 family)